MSRFLSETRYNASCNRKVIQMDSERIPTNLRTLLILEVIGSQAEAITTAEIGRAVGLSKQTIHRLCATLVEEGFLVKDERNRGFRPGRRARNLSTGIMQNSISHVARNQILQDLSQATGETVNYVVPDQKGMSYQDRVETDWPIRVQLPVGSIVPFPCTASGKVYLASLPKAERRRLVNVMHLERHTETTITDPDRLMDELQRISKLGYATDNGEFFDSMNAIAAPVKDKAGRYCASLAIHAPVQRMSVDTALGYKDMLFDASSRLTELLFA